MTLLHRLGSVLTWVFRREKAEQGLNDELQTFVEMSAAEKIRQGIPPSEARRMAALELGGIEQVKEHVRTGRHGAWPDEIARDVRYAFRTFVRNPGFTLVVVLTLALGIGANAAIFSLIDALRLRWLPVQSPQGLLQIALTDGGPRQPGAESFSYPIARALSEQDDIFVGVAGFSSFPFDVGSSGSISRVPGAVVTGEYYDTFGLVPAAGRLLTQRDDEAGAPPVVVISFGYWERRHARRADAIGKTIRVNNVPVQIVGVSPRGFVGATVGSIADITIAAGALPQVSPSAAGLLGSGNFWLRVLARPRQGLSVAQATEKLDTFWALTADSLIAPHWPAAQRKAMAASWFELYPGGTGWTVLRGIYSEPLNVLMAGVALVLLIACANVASLLLARASSRRREFAVRLAIGAGRDRIVRQLLIESTLLSITGAAVGVGLAWISARTLVGMISLGPSPAVFDVTPNWHIVAFASAVAMLCGLLFGIAPALHTTTIAPFVTLKNEARTSGPRSRLLPSLVSAQVALSLILLAGAALFVRTLQNLQNLDPGFHHARVLLVDFEGRRTAVPSEIVEAIQRLPGVESASLSTHTPLSGAIWSDIAVPAGQPLPERDTAVFVGAAPRFFDTMQIQLLAGREFTDRDRPGSPDVAVVNEVFASRHFPKQNVVGQRLSAKVRGRRTELEIVGVARKTYSVGLRREAPATVYVAYSQLVSDFPTTLMVRTSGPVGGVSSAVHQTLQSRLPDAVIEVQGLSAQVEATLSRERMMATLAGAFGVLALTLACIGLYGLLAYNVVQRIKEIGIRMALGARPPLVVAQILKGGARLVLIGVVMGLPAAWGASRWVETLLFGLEPTDPAAIGTAIVILVAGAQLAAYLPARRASRVDPLTALRHE